VDGSELRELLSIFEHIVGPQAATMLTRRLCEQILRAIEIAFLADPKFVDISLNIGLYLGFETIAIETRLSGLLGETPPT
jgi:hypothetical protein